MGDKMCFRNVGFLQQQDALVDSKWAEGCMCKYAYAHIYLYIHGHRYIGLCLRSKERIG